MKQLLLALLVLVPGVAWAFESSPPDRPNTIGPRDPSDPAARVPRIGYVSITAGTKSYRPVDPLPWDELNRRVKPRAKEEPPAKRH